MEQELLDFIAGVITRFKSEKSKEYDWIDAVADELSFFGYVVRPEEESDE